LRVLFHLVFSLAKEQDNHTGTLAVITQAPALAWGRWVEQPQQDFNYGMDISGMIQSSQYDPRAASTAAYSRPVMAPQYTHNMAYSSATTSGMVAQNTNTQHNPFSSATYGTNSNVPPFGANYIQQRPQLQTLPQRPQVPMNGYTQEHHSPTIKPEIGATSRINNNWNTQNVPIAPTYSTQAPSSSSTTSTASGEVVFGTDVDTLMKAIQTKAATAQSSPVTPVKQSYSPAYQHSERSRLTSPQSEDGKPSSKKRYQCNILGCNKAFYQKTHLDIHIRAHTGDKPYVSSSPNDL
jgi:hypothetical protein